MEATIEHIQGNLAGAATTLMVHLGDRLGLYDRLGELGPVTPEELAAETGYSPRYLREWMAQQAVVGILDHDSVSGRFSISPEHALVLSAEETPLSFAGAFEVFAGMYNDIDEVVGLFESGDGLGWGEHDARVHRGTARFFGAAYRQELIDQWVPAAGLSDLLGSGARVADVGCGEGVTTVLLAAAFPESEFVGFDLHEESVEAARRRASHAGVADRTRFEMADAVEFGGGPYDAVWFFDVLHDLPTPSAAVQNARRQLADDGVLCIVEPAAEDELAANIAANPAAALHYAASSFLCIPNSLTDPEGAALGSQAGNRRLAAVVEEGGFDTVEQVAATPMHHVLAARR